MAADFSQYPTGRDIEAMFRSTAFWPKSEDTGAVGLAQYQADIGAVGAAEEWETRTGWGPFLASGQPETRYFDEANYRGELDLGGGLVELQSVKVFGREVAVNFEAQPRVNVGGSGLRVCNKLRLGLGATNYRSWYATESPIAVTGIWGACQSVPPDVWASVYQRGALTTLQQIQNNPGISSLGQAGFNLSFDPVGVISPNLLLTVWGKDFGTFARLWQRVVT